MSGIYELPVDPGEVRLRAGKIGIWLFVASEIMFFMGILVSYVLFRAADPQLFSAQAAVLNKVLGGINTLILLGSSATIAMAVGAARRNKPGKAIACMGLTLVLAALFLGIKASEYWDKFCHYTLIARMSDGTSYVYDGGTHMGKGGFVLYGYRAPLPADNTWDIHLTSPQQMREASGLTSPQTYQIPSSAILEQMNYGPWKNIFFACYFTLTAVHAVHVIGGMIAIAILLLGTAIRKIQPAAIEYVAIYWYFVDVVWIFLFVLLYFA